ncbi:MAG: STAS domain-containing protein [Acidobacteriota bacterium]
MSRPRSTWSLETATEVVPGGVVVSARGRVSSGTAGAFAAALTTACAGTGRVVIDLTGVDYMSGPGIVALRDAGAAGVGRVIICGLQEAVRITLELAGLLDGTVQVEATTEAALARLPLEK